MPVFEYRFGAYSVRSDDLIVRFGGTSLALSPKAVRTLIMLLDNAGRFVSKDELLQSVWNGEAIEESNLSQNIYLLRRQFENASGESLIETLPKRGYKFAHAVSKRQLPTRVAPVGWRKGLGAALVLAVLLLALGAFVTRYEHRPPTQGEMLSGKAEQAEALAWYYWRGDSESDLRESIRDFRQVIVDEPRSADGYAGEAVASAKLADIWQGSPSAEVEAVAAERLSRQALTIDARSPLALAARGFVAYDLDGDYPRAAAALHQAVIAEPDLAVAHEWYGTVLLWQGDLAEAREELARASTLDPSLPDLDYLLALDYYMSRDYQPAIAYAKMVGTDSGFQEPATILLAAAHEQIHQYASAIQDIRSIRSASNDLGARGELAHVYASMGDSRHAQTELTVVERLANTGQSRPLLTALAYSANKRIDDAFAWLSQIPMNARALLSLDPRLDALRNDGRFSRWAHG